LTGTNTWGCEFPFAIRRTKNAAHGEVSIFPPIIRIIHDAWIDKHFGTRTNTDWIRVQGFAGIELAKDAMMAILGSFQCSDS